MITVVRFQKETKKTDWSFYNRSEFYLYHKSSSVLTLFCFLSVYVQNNTL